MEGDGLIRRRRKALHPAEGLRIGFGGGGGSWLETVATDMKAWLRKGDGNCNMAVRKYAAGVSAGLIGAAGSL